MKYLHTNWNSYKKQIGAFCFSFLLIANYSFSQDTLSEAERMELLTKAIEAREKGDVKEARELLEKIANASPEGTQLSSQVEALEAELEQPSAEEIEKQRMAAQANRYESLLGNVEQKQKDAISVAKNRLSNARQALKERNYALSLKELQEAEVAIQPYQSIATKFLKEDLAERRKKVFYTQAKDTFEANEYEDAVDQIMEYNKYFGSDRQIRRLESQLRKEMGSEQFDLAVNAYDERRYGDAKDELKTYRNDYGEDRKSNKLQQQVNYDEFNPFRQNTDRMDPQFPKQEERVKDLLLRGRSMYLAGNLEGASRAFEEIDTVQPGHIEANLFLKKIAERLDMQNFSTRLKTRSQLMEEVSASWQRPRVFTVEDNEKEEKPVSGELQAKIERIKIPRAQFMGMPLSKVVETISELSQEYDFTAEPENKGVNVVLIDQENKDPKVNINLKNLTVLRVLQFVTQQVGYTFEVTEDAIVVSPGTADAGIFMETEFFPISRSAVIRITGGGSSGESAVSNDPFADPVSTSGGSGDGEESKIRDFFERAGVKFEGVPGAALAYEGTELIITQTTKNLERVRTILRRYNETKQVEVEAKFLEVNQADLDELGFDWNVNYLDGTGTNTVLDTSNRKLAGTFTAAGDRNNLTIIQQPENNSFLGATTTQEPVTTEIPIVPPPIPQTLDLGVDVSTNLLSFAGILRNTEFNLLINALQRKSSSDLMTAPKVTVVSGGDALINIGQEFIYPTEYEAAEVETGGGGDGDTASASSSVAITSPLPSDFTGRLVGVELNVNPTVEEGDIITLRLQPTVTEFEGFVEYGSPNIAISGDTTVTVPSGFFQPIFSVRKVETQVSVFDGATVVIGGLTRNEIKNVHDSVPVLGDIPLVGRFFQNRGETSVRRNLLIFVTANMISPGGSPARQKVGNLQPNSLFQNPVIVTPTGTETRRAIVE